MDEVWVRVPAVPRIKSVKMRDIAFRGKRLDNGEWVTDSQTLIIDGDGTWLSDADLNVVKVAPSTLGQFTGLLDRDYKRVYEGDVVNWLMLRTDGVGYMEEGRVEFRDDEQANVVVRKCKTVDGRESVRWLLGCTELKVVGNIYDNPDW